MEKERKFLLGMGLMLSLCGTLTAQQVHTEEWGNGIERSLVYRPGDYNSKFYRIPGIITAKDGSLVTVADKRIEHNGDLPAKIDVVSRRSTDGGKTWSEYVTVAEHNEIGGCGDPALVLDEKSGDILAIFSNGSGIWEGTPAHISVSRSSDNGMTWGPMVDINPQILTTDPLGPQPIKCQAAFATSGRALQLADGRIMFALVTRDLPEPGEDKVTGKVWVVYSDDGGHNWQVSKTPGIADAGNEAKIVELADGRLILSIRVNPRDRRFYNRRIFAYSDDRGETWSDPEPVYDLIEPGCNGDIIRYTHNGKDILLQSIPASPNKRENVTIFASEDNGETWPYKKTVCTTPSAYSSMTEMADGRVGILTEESQNGHYSYSLWFTAIPIEEIMKK